MSGRDTEPRGARLPPAARKGTSMSSQKAIGPGTPVRMSVLYALLLGVISVTAWGANTVAAVRSEAAAMRADLSHHIQRVEIDSRANAVRLEDAVGAMASQLSRVVTRIDRHDEMVATIAVLKSKLDTMATRVAAVERKD